MATSLTWKQSALRAATARERCDVALTASAPRISRMSLRSDSPGPVLAYFLTWTCYGTRLHGDGRGSVDQRHTGYGHPGVPVNPQRVRFMASHLRHEPFRLDAPRRHAVESAIRRTCLLKGWQLHALNVRTNHVHVVVPAPGRPEPAMTSLKAWASKRLIELGLSSREETRWTDHGSTRYLWTREAVERTCDYVTNGQGDHLE